MRPRTLVISIFMLLAGCSAQTVAPHSVTEIYSGNDADSQLSFWHELASRPLTSNDDAFHGLLLYLDQTDPNQNYAQRLEALKKRQMLPADFDQPGNLAVNRGTLAVAICKILEIKGGVMMHLLGPTPRYAVRELVFKGIFPNSSPNQTFSGSEFVGVVGKIEDVQREKQPN